MVSNKIESELAELEDAERAEFLQELNLSEPGLHRVIRAGYKLRGLQQYFTAGPSEVRAWTIPVGAKAPQGAGVIHTDFEKGFIRAEVIGFEDYVGLGGEAGGEPGNALGAPHAVQPAHAGLAKEAAATAATTSTARLELRLHAGGPAVLSSQSGSHGGLATR